MSIGDFIHNIVTVAPAAVVVFQPAVGVEWMILGVRSDTNVGVNPDSGSNAYSSIYNGVLFSFIAFQDNNPSFWKRSKIYVNNTTYLRMSNLSLLSADLGFWGIQTK